MASVPILSVFLMTIPICTISYYFRTRKAEDRNAEIRRRFESGEDVVQLATEYCISNKRIYQILRGQ